MIEVCDLWSLDEFAEMDEEMMRRVLEGWETGEVRSFREVSGGRGGGRKCPRWVRTWRREKGDVWVGLLGGVVGGLVVGLVLGAGLMRRFGGGKSTR